MAGRGGERQIRVTRLRRGMTLPGQLEDSKRWKVGWERSRLREGDCDREKDDTARGRAETTRSEDEGVIVRRDVEMGGSEMQL